MNLKNLCIFIFPAICGAAIVYSITPNNSIGSLGVTAPANGVSTAQAFVVELALTFILVFVVFAATDPGRGLTGYGVPLAIGICVFICLMHGVGLLATNVSLKPTKVMVFPDLVWSQCFSFVPNSSSRLHFLDTGTRQTRKQQENDA